MADAVVLDTSAILTLTGNEPGAEAVIEPAVESRPRQTTGVKDAKIYIDGKFYSEANAKISVFDHGLLYVDGIFEGMRFYNGRVFRLEAVHEGYPSRRLLPARRSEPRVKNGPNCFHGRSSGLCGCVHG